MPLPKTVLGIVFLKNINLLKRHYRWSQRASWRS